jgi:hypothetical protein
MKEIIKNHVSLKSKIIEIHWENNGFGWFRRLHVRTVKLSKKHQNETKFHPKFNEKSIQKTCSKKRIPKYENSSKKWSKNGTIIHQISLQKSMRKWLHSIDSHMYVSMVSKYVSKYPK